MKLINGIDSYLLSDLPFGPKKILSLDDLNETTTLNAINNIKTKGKPPKGAEYSYSDGVLQVVIESLRKVGRDIVAAIMYMNVSGETFTVRINSMESHILNENGERWHYNWDHTSIKTGRSILPGKKIRARTTFSANDSRQGTIFDLFLESYGDSHPFSISILNIPQH